jgi:hypothetical protein
MSTKPLEGIRSTAFSLDQSLDQIDTISITMAHLCAALDQVPGARLGALWLDSEGELQLGVETYDPVSDTWRVVITFARGRARVEQKEIEDRQGAAYRAVAQLTRILDACFLAEDGVGLWGEEWGEDRDEAA